MHASADREGQFEVALRTAEDVDTFVLTGELDIATADQLTDALNGASGESARDRVIDLSGVTFMDSTGLRVLISANRAAAEAGYSLTIVTGESPAKRVLELTRMDEHMRVVTSAA